MINIHAIILRVFSWETVVFYCSGKIFRRRRQHETVGREISSDGLAIRSTNVMRAPTTTIELITTRKVKFKKYNDSVVEKNYSPVEKRTRTRAQ